MLAGTFSGLISPSASEFAELLTRGPAPDFTGLTPVPLLEATIYIYRQVSH